LLAQSIDPYKSMVSMLRPYLVYHPLDRSLEFL
jgi:hypothetical protein